MPMRRRDKRGKDQKQKTKGTEHEPSSREIYLQEQLDRKVRQLAEFKLRLQAAKEESRWLNDEAHRLQIEHTEYKRFVSKKSNLRLKQIVTLSDYHRQEIEDLQRDKEKMIEDYQRKKQEYRSQLIRKEQLLREFKAELQPLEGYKFVRERQGDEIERLREEIARVRTAQVKSVNEIKSTFEKEMEQRRLDDEAKLEQIQRQADREVVRYLYDQSINIQDESLELRIKLKDLLKRNEYLNDIKQRLEEEQINIIGRLRLAEDLKRISIHHLTHSSDHTSDP